MRVIYALHKAISALHMHCTTCAGFYMTCQIVQLHNKHTQCFYLNLCNCAILHEHCKKSVFWLIWAGTSVVYATESVLLGTNIKSVAFRYEDIRRYPWYITTGY